MTEQEAMTKRCCGPDDCGEMTAEGFRNCEGHTCMAWRSLPVPASDHGFCGLAGRPLED